MRRSAMLANQRRAHWENQDMIQPEDEILKHQGSSHEDMIQGSESDALRHAAKLKAFTQAEAENPTHVWELQEEPEQEEARFGRPTLPEPTPSLEAVSRSGSTIALSRSGSKSALSRSGSKSTLSRSGSKSALSERPPWRAGKAAPAPRGDNDLGQARPDPASSPRSRRLAAAPAPRQQRSVAPTAHAHVPAAPAPAPAPAPSRDTLAAAGERKERLVRVAAAVDGYSEVSESERNERRLASQAGSEEVDTDAAAHARRRSSPPRTVAAGAKAGGTGVGTRAPRPPPLTHAEGTTDGEAAACGRADAEASADGDFGAKATCGSAHADEDDFAAAMRELARYLREDAFQDFHGKLLDEYCIDAVTCSAGAEIRLVHAVMQAEFEGRVEAKLGKRLGKRRLVLVTSGVQELARGEMLLPPDLDPEDVLEVINVLAPTPVASFVDVLLGHRSDRLGRGAHMSREEAIRVSFFPRLPVCPTDLERELEWVWNGVLPPEPEPDDMNGSGDALQSAAAEKATEPRLVLVA